MKVHVVEEIIASEGGQCMGVFSTEQKAQEYVTDQETKHPDHYKENYCWLEISEFEIDSWDGESPSPEG